MIRTDAERQKLQRQILVYRTLGTLCIGGSVIVMGILTMYGPYRWYQDMLLWLALGWIALFPWHRLF